ncbi:MAG: crotonase/enoyl-CoA hydratase family protein [Actinomycetota bacterium]|nr:crotonase/enoyl-CoA hydratase family protein [Actinomycetota bacterium]
MTVRFNSAAPVALVEIDRPEVRNAVDGPTARALVDAFERFESDDDLLVAVLYGAGGSFCSGADLKAMANDPPRANPIDPGGIAPMGPSRMVLSKPVLAAVEGYAVAGGMELALWCDLRIAGRDATFGFYDRRWGVPLIDGGTVRLPRLIGHSRAMDLLLTGRSVGTDEAYQIGLVNRVVDAGTAVEETIALANELARFPQAVMRADRLNAIEQWGAPLGDAMRMEFDRGTRAGAESVAGAARFASGKGRHGSFDDL